MMGRFKCACRKEKYITLAKSIRVWYSNIIYKPYYTWKDRIEDFYQRYNNWLTAWSTRSYKIQYKKNDCSWFQGRHNSI